MNENEKTQSQLLEERKVYDIKDILKEKERREAEVRRRKLRRRSATLIISVVLVICISLYSLFYVRKGYSLSWSIKRAETTNYEYEKFVDGFIEVGTSAANYYSNENKLIWSTYLEFNAPKIRVKGIKGVIFDSLSNRVLPFDKEKFYKEIRVDGKVLGARISDTEKIIILAEKNDEFSVSVYDYDGRLTIKTQSVLDTRGAPVDFDFSKDDKYLAISYLQAGEKGNQTNIVVYDVKELDEKKRIYGQTSHPLEVISQLSWTSPDTLMAIGATKVYTYGLENRALKVKEVSLDDKVVRARILDDEVVAVKDLDKGFNLVTFDKKLNENLVKDIYETYNKLRITDDRLVLFKDERIIVYSLGGRIDLDLKFDEEVRHVFKYSSSSYVIVLENKIISIDIKLF